jgi:hypothetical protein
MKLAVGAAVALPVLWAALGTFRFVLVLVALALLVAGLRAATWAFVPRHTLPRNRIRHMKLRLFLRLHPGPGHATAAELHRHWGRRASALKDRYARP